MRRTRRRADDADLGDRRVDDALLAELVDQSVGDLERSAVRADVFADAEDVLVALHLLEQRLANRLEVGDLGHQGFSLRRGVRAPAFGALVDVDDARRPFAEPERLLGRRIGVDADERVERLRDSRLLGDVGRFVDFAAHPLVDRLDLAGGEIELVAQTRDVARRADRSRAPSVRSRPSGTYDWLSCSACPFRR